MCDAICRRRFQELPHESVDWELAAVACDGAGREGEAVRRQEHARRLRTASHAEWSLQASEHLTSVREASGFTDRVLCRFCTIEGIPPTLLGVYLHVVWVVNAPASALALDLCSRSSAVGGPCPGVRVPEA